MAQAETFSDLSPPRTIPIIERLELGLERMAARKMEVRAICLVQEDRDALDEALSEHWSRISGSKAKVFACSYKGHPVRLARNARGRSSIYSKQGVGICLPNPRESRRTK